MENPFYLAYTSTGVPDTYRARSQRRAVLVPLLGKVPRRQIARQVLGKDGLLSRWRTLLAGLSLVAEAGTAWGDRLACRYDAMRNCRPTFIEPRVATSATFRACGAPTFCPFCWGRRVGELYDAVEWALFLDPALPRLSPAEEARRHMVRRPSRRIVLEGTPPPRPRLIRSPHDLIERVTRLPTSATQLLVGREYAATLGVDPRESLLPYLIKGRVHGPNRASEFGRPGEFSRCRKFGVLGAYENFSIGVVEPRPADEECPGRRGRWTIQFRQLLVVPHRWKDDDPAIRAWLDEPAYGFPVDGAGDSRKARWRRHRNPDRRLVSLAVGRAAAYDPVLLAGTPKRVLEILEGREGKRLSATFGVLRNATARACRDEDAG